MAPISSLNGIVFGLAILLCLAGTSHASDQKVEYTRDIRPILARNCLTCHGPDEEAREAGLRLDVRESVLSATDSGAIAVVPGDPAASELFRRMTTDDEFLRMPPTDTGHRLSPAEIELVQRWIEQGANYSVHWSFQPLRTPDVPDVRYQSWPCNTIDRFILSRLEAEGIRPAEQASRRTLIRRLSLDLIGLPPTLDEVQAFLNDTQPMAYERLVDRLLGSPHFGERWARHWLDLARYADSDGYLGDDLRPYAYLYRNWVIAAINDDMPFDQFTIKQIAGDLLPNATTATRIATGFHRNAMKNTEAGVDKEADRVIRTVDRVGTVGTVWLGMTVACAECHSHKYDPISQQEFYSLYAFFNGLEDHDMQIAAPATGAGFDHDQAEEELRQLRAMLLTTVTPAEETADALQLLATPQEDRTDNGREFLQAWNQNLNPDHRKLAERFEYLAHRPGRTSIKAPVVAAPKRQPQTYIHERGDFRRQGVAVQPGTPAFLAPLEVRGEHADRLDLAHWLVGGENPLPPRVEANRIWKHLFGRGLVDTEENLGISGSSPSHPELLDWLAARFVEKRWSRKALIREIVLSATYRQSSNNREELREIDPENRLLGRQSRFRVDAEIVRDLALSTSGLLNRSIGGASILPPLNSRLAAISRNQTWKVSEGTEQYRRGMYILFRRATPYPMLTVFDAPDSTTTCADRERSNSPLQALTLLNDPVFSECAQHLGYELSQLGNVEPKVWIESAFERCLGRRPRSIELERLIAFYQEQRSMINKLNPKDVRALGGNWTSEIDLPEQAARVVVARSLMNCDEFFTRE